MKNTVLLVEDDKILRDMYELKFTKSGYKVKSCAEGHEALDWLSNNTAQLAIVDILLPRINGIVLLKSIRKDQRHNSMRIIILTNLTESDINLRSTIKDSLGVDAYFVKSQITPSQLESKISVILQ
jgi:DNA-binding response OmpR family regulator